MMTFTLPIDVLPSTESFLVGEIEIFNLIGQGPLLGAKGSRAVAVEINGKWILTQVAHAPVVMVMQ